MIYNKKRIQKLAGLREGYDPFTESTGDSMDDSMNEMDQGAVAGLAGAATGAAGIVGAVLTTIVSNYKKLKKDQPDGKPASLIQQALKTTLQSLSTQHGGL